MCGRKVMFQTMKKVASLSDTITIEQSSHHEQRIPRNMVVTMITRYILYILDAYIYYSSL
jgi:hypothetical protein